MSEIQWQDLIRNPSKFGAPTFEDFKRNRSKYLGHEEDTLRSADIGSIVFKKGLKKYRYELEGYRCQSLEEVERVAKSQGIALSDLDYRPEFIPLGGGQAEMLVKFISKHERQKRSQI